MSQADANMLALARIEADLAQLADVLAKIEALVEKIALGLGIRPDG